MVSIGWQSQLRRDALLDLLATRASDALKQWAGVEGIVSSFDHARPVVRVADCWMFDARCGGIVLMAPANAFGELGRRLLGTHCLDGFGLSEGLGKRAVVDLLASMCRLTPSECAIEERYSPSPKQLDARRGVASFHWRLADLELVLHLDATLCDHVLPRQRTLAMPLTDRAAASLDSVVEVKAVVGLGQMDVLKISDLKPGYIIKTDARLDAPLQLMLGGEVSSLVGQLVALGECRAFRRCANTQGELT